MLAGVAALTGTMTVTAATASDGVERAVRALAPHGQLRACLGYGNPILMQQDPSTREPRGITVDLARELGRRLNVPVELVMDGPGGVTDALSSDRCDIVFQAVDPVRAERVAYTAPYVVFEGRYVVRRDSAIRVMDDVDHDGVRIAVPRGSAYDLYLGRTLKHAQLIRFTSGAEAINAFSRDNLEVIAGATVSEAAFAKRRPDLRVLPGHFMTVGQAIGIPQTRAAGLPYLRAFIEEMKASGFVSRELAALGETDAVVAPPAP